MRNTTNEFISGVISLGISVAQGLIKYYSSWKDAPHDTATTIDSLDGLVQILKQIDSSYDLREKQKSELEGSVKACEVGVKKLQQKLEKVQHISNKQSPTVGDKVKSHYLRALYPFKESTLAKLREIVSDLKGNLSLAVGVAHL